MNRVGPDDSMGPIRSIAFRFGHAAFGRDFGGNAGERVLVDAATGFLFSFGQSDRSKDGAEDSACRKNFIGREEEVLGEDNAIVFDLERKGEA